MRLEGLAAVVATVLVGSLMTTVAHAAPVECHKAADRGPNDRYVVVSPGLVDGACVTQAGNIDPGGAIEDFVFALSPTGELIDKDVVGGADDPNANEARFSYTILNNTNALHDGTFALDDLLWDDYARLFVAFHFGNGSGNPDSFLVELKRRDTAGTWQFIAPGTSGLNALSNIYLYGRECTAQDDCDDSPPTGVPAPGLLGLLGLGLLGFGIRRSVG